MTTRQKTGLGIMLTGVLTGGVMIGWEVTPDWVALAIQLVTLVAGAFGVIIGKKA